MDLRVCGGVEVEVDGRVLPESLLAGRQGRLALAYLACERHRAVRREELADLLWPQRLPETWAGSLSAVISRLRRLFGEAGLNGAEVLVASAGTYQLRLPAGSTVDVETLAAAVDAAETAATAGDPESARGAASQAESIAARGFIADDSEWVDRQRDAIRALRVRAGLALSAAHLASGAPARAVDAARTALDLDPSVEASYRQLMAALAAAGERGEALRVWDRCRATLVEELGADPSPETEAVYLQLLGGETRAAPVPGSSLPSGVVTFLLTDIVESSALWEQQPAAMAVALERHDEIVGKVVGAHGGTLLKSKLEGDATVSVFARASEGVAASLALADSLEADGWPAGTVPRVRMALHTGEAFERDGDYFGPALNRAARLRSLAGAGEVILSQTTADLAREHLPEGVALAELGHRELRGLSRGENVFALRRGSDVVTAPPANASAMAEEGATLERPPVPAVLLGSGPFVGRAPELERLAELWDRAVAGEPHAAFIGGEPGVGKSRLAGELASQAIENGGIVLYGRCDEDLAAPLQPFIEAVRTLAPVLGEARLGSVRGIDELGRVVPELGELLPEMTPATRADPDTERLALFDAMAALFTTASRFAPVLLVLDDLHWAGKSTLSLLRHLLRGARNARVLVVGTYRDTELTRTHPLQATLADLRRDGVADRVPLTGLAASDVATYLTALGISDRALGRELADVTSGNPFFLIEVLRHVEDAGGRWEPGHLPEGVRDATGRRLSRLTDRANDALAIAAVAGTTFDLPLVEAVAGSDLVDEIAEACRAGLLVEEDRAPNRFRFAHALVRQVLLAELVTMKRLRLHRQIAELLESTPVTTAEADARLADLAYHWFECALAGGATKAVDACRRAADRAFERLAYEEAGDLYAMALQALDAVDEDIGPDDRAALHLARCEALLTAGDVAGARAAVDAFEAAAAAAGSERLAAWYTTYAGQLAVLAEPDRLTEIVRSIGAAAAAMRAAGDLVGEAKAHYVHAAALERLGRIGDAERALDAALAAARNGGDRRLQDAVLAEAPQAALWGPSPVTRASGRCLDVIRVLRITEGAPAVEAVALRCQGMLEALRGRTDAARRMVGSSARTVEHLGLTHRRLEADVAAGFVELLDGQPARAEELLRPAYAELRDRGLDGEAAQAAAFLGRALLLQGEVDAADAVAIEASGLAGADLKAAIAWRDVRALAAIERGDTELALTLAREAVDLAAPTDALLLVADARLTLASVLRSSGDVDGARAEAQRALEAAEAKGATVLADLARSTLGTPVPPPQPHAAPEPRVDSSPFDNDANEYFRRVHAAYRDRDWAAMERTFGARFETIDRRTVVAVTTDLEQSMASNRFMLERGTTFDREPIATRGRSLALERWTIHVLDPEASSSVLSLSEVDEEARGRWVTMFDDDALDEALAALDAAYLAGEGAAEAQVFQRITAFVAALDGVDEAALRAHLGPAFVARSHHSLEIERPPLSAEEWIASLEVAREVFAHGHLQVRHIPLLRPWVAVVVLAAVGEDPDGGGSYEYPFLVELRMTGAGVRSFDNHAVEHADEVLAQHGTPADRRPRANLAWENAMRFLESDDARDWDGIVSTYGDQYSCDDQRSVVGTSTDRAASIAGIRFVFDGGDRFDIDLLATRGQLLSLSRWTLTLDDPPAEEVVLLLQRVTPEGAQAHTVVFDADDVDTALAELDRLYREEAGADGDPFENDAFRAALRFRDACVSRERNAVLACVSPAFRYLEHRAGVHLSLEGDDALAAYDALMALDQFEYERTLIATRGDRLALVHDLIRFVDGETGPAEAEVLGVAETDAEGLIARWVGLEPDAIDEAFDELDGRYIALGGADLRPYRRTFNSNDWVGLRDLYTADCVLFDHRLASWAELDVEGMITYHQGLLDLAPDYKVYIDHILAVNARANLTIGRNVGTSDGGAFEIWLASVGAHVDDGRIRELHFFDLANLDEARAQYDRFAAPPVEEPFANAAWRATQRLVAASNERDREAFAAALAPGFEYIERRSGIVVHHDVNDGSDIFPVMFELDEYRTERRLLATRGDRLALEDVTATFRDGASGEAEIACICLVEVDDDEQIVRQVTFDVDATAVAYAELESRHLALGGRDVDAFRTAYDTRDWDGFVEMFEPDCLAVHHHLPGGEWRDLAGFVDAQRELVELSPDSTMWIDHVRGVGNGASLVVARSVGTYEGGPWELAMITVTSLGPTGRVGTLDLYELADLDEARRRLTELGRPSVERAFANRAWAAVTAVGAAFNARNQAALDALFAVDYVDDDRRAGVSLVSTGPEANPYRIGLSLDEANVERELLATRQDDLVLVRTLVRFRDGDSGPAEVECLNLVQTDPSGHLIHTVVFGLDDLAAAYDELDARARALGATDHVWSNRTAFTGRDWDSYRQSFSPDLVVQDHRRVGWGTIGPEEFIDLQRAMVELAPDTSMWIDHVRMIDGVDVNVSRQVGTHDGSVWERSVVAVAVRDEQDLISRIECFDVEDLAVALDRVRELASSQPGGT